MPVVRSAHSMPRQQRQRVYANARWHACRAVVLNRDAHRCVLCQAPATIADHHPTNLATLIRQGRDPYDPTTCRAVCKPCHDRQL